MDPTQQIQKAPLFEEATSRRIMKAAWFQVRPRVVHAKDPRVRAAAEEFGRDLDRSVARLQRDLRSGRFEFEPQRAVLKRSKSKSGIAKKDPRPIVVAPVVSRVVQRAILDTCQCEKAVIRRRLGELPKIIATETSVGGLPGRGVPEAITLITRAIAAGAKWFVRSDLKKFFQTVPKSRVEEFLRLNISDRRFIDLFMRALATELENGAEVREYIDLFPLGPIGVPQGSALSALCANVVLREFDAKLNGRGLCTVRYLDDFVILGPSRRAVEKGWVRAQEIVKALGMECHDPSAGTGKAARGEIAAGFEFLSFHIDEQDVYPTNKARNEFLADLAEVIGNAKRAINGVKDEPRRAEPRFIQSLDLLDRKIRGWGDAFEVTTKRVVLNQLDAEIDRIVDGYMGWFGRARRERSATHQRRLMGIALLADTRTERGSNEPGSNSHDGVDAL